jgi:hypothetical protein
MAWIVGGRWGEVCWDGGGGRAGWKGLVEVDDLGAGEVWVVSLWLLLARRGKVCVAGLRHGLDGC